MINLSLAFEIEQNQHEKSLNTGSVLHNLFSEEPNMDLQCSNRIRKAPINLENELFESRNQLSYLNEWTVLHTILVYCKLQP